MSIYFNGHVSESPYSWLPEEDPTDVAGSVDLYLELLIGTPLASLNEWSMQMLPSYDPERGAFQATPEARDAVRDLVQMQLAQVEIRKAIGMLGMRSRSVFQFGMSAREKGDDHSRGIAARCFFIHDAVDQLMRILNECSAIERV